MLSLDDSPDGLHDDIIAGVFSEAGGFEPASPHQADPAAIMPDVPAPEPVPSPVETDERRAILAVADRVAALETQRPVTWEQMRWVIGLSVAVMGGLMGTQSVQISTLQTTVAAQGAQLATLNEGLIGVNKLLEIARSDRTRIEADAKKAEADAKADRAVILNELKSLGASNTALQVSNARLEAKLKTLP